MLDALGWPAAQRAVGTHEGVLGQILGVRLTRHEAARNPEDQVLVMLDQHREAAVEVTREAGRAFRAHGQQNP